MRNAHADARFEEEVRVETEREEQISAEKAERLSKFKWTPINSSSLSSERAAPPPAAVECALACESDEPALSPPPPQQRRSQPSPSPPAEHCALDEPTFAVDYEFDEDGEPILPNATAAPTSRGTPYLLRTDATDASGVEDNFAPRAAQQHSAFISPGAMDTTAFKLDHFEDESEESSWDDANEVMIDLPSTGFPTSARQSPTPPPQQLANEPRCVSPLTPAMKAALSAMSDRNNQPYEDDSVEDAQIGRAPTSSLEPIVAEARRRNEARKATIQRPKSAAVAHREEKSTTATSTKKKAEPKLVGGWNDDDLLACLQLPLDESFLDDERSEPLDVQQPFIPDEISYFDQAQAKMVPAEDVADPDSPCPSQRHQTHSDGCSPTLTPDPSAEESKEIFKPPSLRPPIARLSIYGGQSADKLSEKARAILDKAEQQQQPPPAPLTRQYLLSQPYRPPRLPSPPPNVEYSLIPRTPQAAANLVVSLFTDAHAKTEHEADLRSQFEAQVTALKQDLEQTRVAKDDEVRKLRGRVKWLEDDRSAMEAQLERAREDEDRHEQEKDWLREVRRGLRTQLKETRDERDALKEEKGTLMERIKDAEVKEQQWRDCAEVWEWRAKNEGYEPSQEDEEDENEKEDEDELEPAKEAKCD